MNVDIFGYFAAILTTAAFLPQLIKTIKNVLTALRQVNIALINI